ncbi:MAG: TlpA family protein disulfide reductase [Flavisolibacter sp.]|nr:TlpA family protein disulfide reductase [Flavisolibacter sp.]
MDSAWLADNYLPRFYKDSGTYLSPVSFVDDKGNSQTLEKFKGKILYLDMWSTSCRPCIARFPYQEQLFKRVKALNLDSSIVFVNINVEDTRTKWRKALKKYHPVGINLYSSDTSVYIKWNVDALPCYILLDTAGKVLGKEIVGPDDANIDWILYSATKGVHPVAAYWRSRRQDDLRLQHHSSAAFTDEEYAQWWKNFSPVLSEYLKWRKEHSGF